MKLIKDKNESEIFGKQQAAKDNTFKIKRSMKEKDFSSTLSSFANTMTKKGTYYSIKKEVLGINIR